MSKTPFMPLQALRSELVGDGWKTPDTYCNCFSRITNRPAVYLFLLVDRATYDMGMVAYVGMSKKLSQRLTGHPVLGEIQDTGHWAMRWFKPVGECDLRQVEAKYITQFDPPWNINGRHRGVIFA